MKIKSKLLGILMGSIIGLGITTQSHAQANLTEIKVSYQPALYWALPFYVATENNDSEIQNTVLKWISDKEEDKFKKKYLFLHAIFKVQYLRV